MRTRNSLLTLPGGTLSLGRPTLEKHGLAGFNEQSRGEAAGTPVRGQKIHPQVQKTRPGKASDEW